MAAAKSNTNWFAIGISIAVVVVLVVLGGLVVFLNNQANDPGTAPQSAIINDETGAIVFGDGDTEIDTYVDFMCPICGDFEDAYGEQLQSAAANGDITLNVHPISILNRYSTTNEYSSLAAGSMYCVAAEAPDSALDYFNALFTNQPAENTAGLTADELTALAEEAGAGAAADCIADGSYMKFTEAQADEHEISGTPTVEIDGERIENSEISARFAEILG